MINEQELIIKGRKYFMPNYAPREMILDRGEGSRLWDISGKDYIDFTAGIGVNSLGHNNQILLDALKIQADKLWHTSNIFFTQPAIELAEMLVNATDFAERVYFANSGTEANEAAIKLARKYAADNGCTPENREIITFKNSFHGRTMGSLAATAQFKYQQDFLPMAEGFKYVAGFNDIDAVCSSISEKTIAIMVEPIQGEGGVIPAEAGFLTALRSLADEKNLLLIYDEIQCGIGRTGKLFSYMYCENAAPDILTTAKALGCGVPIGSVLAGEKVAETFSFGSHGSTFGGNPLMCAVALAAFYQINSEEIYKNIAKQSLVLINTLKNIDIFSCVRGQGLMIGAELKENFHGRAGEICEIARENGLLLLVAGGNVLRFLPPLNITDEEIAEGLKRLKIVITNI